MFNVSCVYPETLLYFYDSTVKNVIAINGGLINLVHGNGAKFTIHLMKFYDTTAYGLGGIISVNPFWSTTSSKLTSDSYSSEIKFLLCIFENNYLDYDDPINSSLDRYYYHTSAGYIAFINQIKYLWIAVENSNIT